MKILESRNQKVKSNNRIIQKSKNDYYFMDSQMPRIFSLFCDSLNYEIVKASDYEDSKDANIENGENVQNMFTFQLKTVSSLILKITPPPLYF